MASVSPSHSPQRSPQLSLPHCLSSQTGKHGGYTVKRMVRVGDISVRRISHANHTFSRSTPRGELISLVLEVIKRGPGSPRITT